MSQPTHVIDPDGEVVILLKTTGAPFVSGDIQERPSSPSSRTGMPQRAYRRGSNGIEIFCSLPKFINETPRGQVCRIQVSAHQLGLASPVFKEMLFGAAACKECLPPSKHTPKEIAISAWDFYSFWVFLNIIHGTPNTLPPLDAEEEIPLELVAKIGVLANFFDCRDKVQYLVDMWIDEEYVDWQEPVGVYRDTIMWLWIAWFFRRETEFKSVTSTIMSQVKDRISHLGLPMPPNVLGELVDQINTSREEGIQEFLFFLGERQNEFLLEGLGCSVECSERHFDLLTKHMALNGLHYPETKEPFIGLAYCEIVQKIFVLKGPCLYCTKDNGGCPSTYIPEGYARTVNGLDLCDFQLNYC